MSALSLQLLGNDSSVTDLAELITERAAGNPFFAEELVRDLSERDVLVGGRGCYLCAEPIADVHVPRTLQAVIAARIDRLEAAAKRTLNAAAVIGSRFTQDMLQTLDIDANLRDLVAAELVDQTAVSPHPEFTFRHPLIRAVAYESQLKSDRTQLHRRVAAAIEQNDQNAALIAEHFAAAGDLRAAYGSHMRAGAWSINRDNAAAQLSWERAITAADGLPDDEPDVLPMRIAPRSLLCSNTFRRIHPDSSVRFDELRQLCTEADDKASLAIGMAGLVMEHIIRGRMPEASRLASENMALIESIGDPKLTVALSFASCVAKVQVGEIEDTLRWSQAVIDLAEHEPGTESIILGSPLAMAISFRCVARWSMGLPGWRDDIQKAVALGRTSDAVSHVAVVTYCYNAVAHGVLHADDVMLAEIGVAMEMAEKASEDIALTMIRLTMGYALAERRMPDVERGYDMLARLHEACIADQYALNTVNAMQAYAAKRKLAHQDLDGAIAQARATVDAMFSTQDVLNCDFGIDVLVKALLARGTGPDIAEAEAAVHRLARLATAFRWVVRDVYVLQLRALLAQARGDDAAYRDFRDRYRAMASAHGYEGHMKWADAMP